MQIKVRSRNLHEDNHERKQYQRFDKSQAQNQRELDERTRRRIASHSFASRRAYLTLACAASPAAIAIAKPAVMATQFVPGTALPPVCAKAGTAIEWLTPCLGRPAPSR